MILSTGDTVWQTFPPPDSTYVSNQLILKFYDGGLERDSLCYDCNSIIYSISPVEWAYCKNILYTHSFSVGVIKDPVIRSILQSKGVTHLKRMTAANPCADTLSITRNGDTIRMDHYNWMVAHFNNDTSVIATLVALYFMNAQRLHLASPNFYYEAAIEPPGDPEYWADLPNFAGQESLRMIGMPYVWERAVGAPWVKVAVIDKGVDYDRCELGQGIGVGFKVVDGWDYNTNTRNACKDDPQASPHGTPVASVIGALTNTYGCPTANVGMAGIAGGWYGPWNGASDGGTGVSLVAYRVQEGADKFPSSWCASAIMDASAMSLHSAYGTAAHVINNSWGSITGGYFNPILDPVVRVAATSAFQNNVSMVNAKHNQSADVSNYPSDFDPPKNFIAVGASIKNGTRADYSNYNTFTDLLAPGGPGSLTDPDQIVIAQRPGFPDFRGPFNGTSAATPHVSGVVALLRGWFQPQNVVRPFTEDWEGMIVSAAKDLMQTDELHDPMATFGIDYQLGYDNLSGWGNLKADVLFAMTNPNIGGFDLFHHTIPFTACDIGEWSDPFEVHFVDYGYTEIEGIDWAQWRPTSKQVKIREIVGTTSYSSEINMDRGVYVWGAGGTTGIGEMNYYGWSRANPNSAEPWCEVISGTGVQSQFRREAILHNHSREVTAHSYQYLVWNELAQKYTGPFPPDDRAGVSFTVFASTKPNSSVSNPSAPRTRLAIESDLLRDHLRIILPEGSVGSLKIYDNLGREVHRQTVTSLPAARISTRDWVTGHYFVSFVTKEEHYASHILIHR